MHGVARTARRRTEEQQKQDLVKIQKYRELEDQTRAKVADNAFGQETLVLTSRLLKLNPEYYTIWNVRRRCLTSGLLSKPSASSSPSRASSSGLPTSTKSTSSVNSSSSSSAVTTLPGRNPLKVGRTGTTHDDDEDAADRGDKDLAVLRGELDWTIPLLIEFPKCYWIWNYRLWILSQSVQRLALALSRRIWEEELGLVGKMLTKDWRNFHAWGYRRHVVAKLESEELEGRSMVEAEFAYTTKMIHADLSNFSAWHNRSKLIPRLLDERGANEQARRKFLEEEFKLISEGLNVGPEDQSLWYYHQFLMLNLTEMPGPDTIAPALSLEERATYLRQEINNIRELSEDYTDVKCIYEALFEYTGALCKMENWRRQRDVTEMQDLRTWLASLKRLDPMRMGRWRDVESECGLL